MDVDASPLIAGDELYAIAYNSQLMARKLMTGDSMEAQVFRLSRHGGDRHAIVLTDSHMPVCGSTVRNGLELWSNAAGKPHP